MRPINGLLLLLFITKLITACKETPQNASQTSGQENSQGSQTSTVEMVESRHAQPVSVNYPETGVDVGWGWDSEEGMPQANVCIEYAIEEDKGQTEYMTMREITDSSELMSSMSISAAVWILSGCLSPSLRLAGCDRWPTPCQGRSCENSRGSICAEYGDGAIEKVIHRRIGG